jgi:Recombinase
MRMSYAELFKRALLVVAVALVPVLIWYLFDVILMAFGAIILAMVLRLGAEPFCGLMGVKSITTYLNGRRIFTRDGGRWGIGQDHRILTRPTYIGRHEFNKRSRARS